MTLSTERFSDRVENYIKYRPGYPQEAIATLVNQTGLNAHSVVADIGAGTGIFTRLLLEQGLSVLAVEPNANMRNAAEARLSGYSRFSSIDAPAESTGLPSHSVDLITAAQSFHWFNNAQARSEFCRILKPGAWLALIWNQRRLSQPFQQAYEAVLNRYATDYQSVNHMNLADSDIADFFAGGQMRIFRFDNCQRFDFSGLLGRLQSSSYCPQESSPAYASLVAELNDIFTQFAVEGVVSFDYDTRLFLGHINPGPE